MREKLIELLETVVSPNELLCYGEVLVSTSRVADHLIANGVTIPVRCKDCKHTIINENHPNKPLICCLTRMCGTVKPEWFCADGERKDK